MPESAVTVPRNGTAHGALAPAPASPSGNAQALLGAQGALLGIVPLGAGARLAIVGYLLPAGGRPGPGQPHDGLIVDAAQHRALVDGCDIGLVHLEFELLAFLTAHPRRAFTRAQLLACVWGKAYEGGDRTVDVHVHRLRRKLGPEYGRCVVTMRHLGYLYREPAGLRGPGPQ
jgi:Transcriptional regulatory protein, C terminal